MLVNCPCFVINGIRSLSERRAAWLSGALLALMTFAAYAPALRGGFLWDDDRYVSENPLMTVPGGLRRIWSVKQTDQYYPLVYSTFWAERRLWGLDPIGYHVANVMLHILNALLVWLLLRRLGLENAWLAAAIFALHPVHVESVAWISERKNVLSGLFYLLALVSYLNFEETEDRRFYFGAFVLFVLALLSKTVTCTLPAVILLLAWMRGRRVGVRDVARLVPFFVVGAGAGMLTRWVEHASVVGHDWDLSIWQRSMLAGRAAWFYAGKLAWPSRLSFSYERWILDPRDFLQWSWDALWLGGMLLLWLGRKKMGRGPLAGALFFLLTLSPALGFVNVYPQRYSFVADHFQYLGSLGLIAVFAVGASRLAPAAALAALLPVLGFLTWRQAHIYKNLDTLWRDTAAKNPRSVIAHTNLGWDLYIHGRTDDAIAQYRAALEIEPSMPETNMDLGLAYAKNGRDIDAMTQYLKALKYNPQYVATYLYIGDLLLSRGRNREAAAAYASVLWLNPNLPAATYSNAGYALAALGDYPQAIRHLREAIRIDPSFVEAHVRLGDAFAVVGRKAEALAEYRTALKLDPASAEAKAHAAFVLKNS